MAMVTNPNLMMLDEPASGLSRGERDRLVELLEALAAGVRSGLNILSGWRFEEFGKDALDLVEGRLAFAIENGKLKMTKALKEPVDA